MQIQPSHALRLPYCSSVAFRYRARVIAVPGFNPRLETYTSNQDNRYWKASLLAQGRLVWRTLSRDIIDSNGCPSIGKT